MMHFLRRACLLSLLLLLLPVWAQEGGTTPPDPERELPPVVTTPPPEQPPSATTPTPQLPPAAPAATRLVITSRRQIFSAEQGLFFFYGDVNVTIDNIVIKAGEVTYNTENQLAIARGNVSILAEDGSTYWGNVLEYNIRNRVWRFLDWSVEYPPGFLGAPFIAPVIIGGEEVTGLPTFLRAQNTRVTTCDLPTPHYYLTSTRVEIYPGDKLIAWDNDFYVLGHRVLHLPWFFLSLRQYRSPIVPEFGQNEFEGYYLRLLYQYVLNPDQLGGVRLDLTEKLGIGIGVDHFYTVPGGSGEAFVYGRQNLDEYVVRVEHLQQLPADIEAAVTADIRNDSLFTSQATTITNVNTRLLRRTTHSNSLFNYTRRLNEGFFTTDNTSANLRYDQRTAGGNFRYSGEYSSFGRAGTGTDTAADQELWNRINWSRNVALGTLNLRIDEREDVDGDAYTGDERYSAVQRLPEIYLETDQSHMAWNLLKGIPSQFTVGWGIFDEQPSDLTLNRYLFNWQATPRPIEVGRTTYNLNTSFRQTFYGDEDKTALYSYSAGLTARTRFGSALTNVFSYRRQEGAGFTPLRIDSTYPYETANESLQYITPNLRMYLTTGRDLDNQRWQDVNFRSEARLATNVTTSQALAYDLNNDRWRDLVSQFSWFNDPRLIFNLGSRYDLQDGHLRRVSTEMEWVVNPKWRVQWLGGYDGINKELLYNEFLVTRDLHCWDASVYYSYQNRYVYFYLRLKALNTPLPRFGIGRGGQVLDTSQGTQF